MDKTTNGSISIISASLRGATISLIIAMALILVFAFVVKLANLAEGMINPINQIIKIVSIFFGVLSSTKKGTKKWFIKGLIVGLLFSVLSFLMFSILNNFTFSFTPSLFWDILLGTLVGGLCSIIVYYIKK